MHNLVLQCTKIFVLVALIFVLAALIFVLAALIFVLAALNDCYIPCAVIQ